MAAGKTFDLLINGQSTSTTGIAPYKNALAVYDRELSLSGNATERDAGMLAYIGINPSAGLPAAGVFGAAVARADTYSSVVSWPNAHGVRSIEGRHCQRHKCIWS